MQRIMLALTIGVAIALRIGGAQAAMTITPEVQAMIDRHVTQIQEWIADPVIVKAVAAQNKQGPMEGIDNRKWKRLRRRAPEIKALRSNEVARFLREKQAHSQGMISQLVLSAAQGEKVAFTNKPPRYLSQGEPAFDRPFASGKVWHGKPKFEAAIQTHVLKVAAPVLVDGKPGGVLVMGIQLGHLEKMGKMHDKPGMKMQH